MKAKNFIFRISQESHQNPVEQQTPGGATQPDRSLWVINSSDMIWDADDIWKWYGSGRIERGQTVSISKKVICDWKSHLCGITCLGKRAEFEVSISIYGEHINHSIVAPSNGEARCLMMTPDYVKSTDKLISISNGRGQVYEVVFSIKNIGRRKRFSAMGEIAHITTQRQFLYSSCLFPVTVNGNRIGYDPNIKWSVN